MPILLSLASAIPILLIFGPLIKQARPIQPLRFFVRALYVISLCLHAIVGPPITMWSEGGGRITLQNTGGCPVIVVILRIISPNSVPMFLAGLLPCKGRDAIEAMKALLAISIGIIILVLIIDSLVGIPVGKRVAALSSLIHVTMIVFFIKINEYFYDFYIPIRCWKPMHKSLQIRIIMPQRCRLILGPIESLHI